MISQNSNAKLFETLSSEHRLAEIAIKEAENFNGEISIPALKEIRDAYHHLDIALKLEDISAQEKELYRAISHCKRAYFDAKECTFMYLLETVEEIKNRAGEYLFILPNYIADYSIHKKAIKSAINFFCTIEDLAVEAREERYKACDLYIKALTSFLQDYSDYEEEILADIEKRKKNDFWNKKSISISIVSLIFGILGLISAFIF